MSKISRITCSYTSYVEFNIPREVRSFLLSPEDNTEDVWGNPGSWYIKWATLHYTNEEGEEETIQGEIFESDYKEHDSLEVSDSSADEEEEEEEEEDEDEQDESEEEEESSK